MPIDYERAAVLMDVIHKVSTISPKNKSILGMAQLELDDIEAAATEERMEIAESRRQAEEDAKPKAIPASDDEETTGGAASVFPKSSGVVERKI